MADTEQRFDVRHALSWLGLIFLALVVALFLWFGGRILLLAFAGILLAVVLRAFMGVLERRLGVPDRLAYVLVILVILAMLAGFGWLSGPRVVEQAGQFTERLPQFIEDVRSWLEQRGWGRWVIGQVDGVTSGGDTQGTGQQSPQGATNGQAGAQGAGGAAESAGGGMGANVASTVFNTIRRIGGALADLALVVVLALFLAFKPSLYRQGIIRLFPAAAQQRAQEVIDELGTTLKYWLVGQLALMVLTGLLTGIGLVILGIPLSLALALFVGLMEFIPFVGPILGFVPIVIVATSQGTTALLSVSILYLIVQQIEGNVLTPLVQQRAVSLPPALTVSAVFLGGALFGPLGVILGTPLMAVLYVLVKMLYVHDVLDQTVQVPGKTETA